MNKKHCKECGGSQINHTFSYLSSLITAILDPLGNIFGRFVPEQTFENIMQMFLPFYAAFGLVSTRTSSKQADGWRARALWEEAEGRNIKLTEYVFLGKSSDVFISSFENQKRYFEGLPRPQKYNRDGSRWMDYKSKMKYRLIKAGIPVARGGTAWTKHSAQKIFNRINKPVIVKPNDGSRSRHTRVHISDMKSLMDAFISARQLGPSIMIEEELSGFVYRGTLVGKKLVAVCRREPAYVIGDGVRTIKELFDAENNDPLRQGPIFQHIPLHAAERELAHGNKTWESVPAHGEYVALGQKTSRAVGGGITDVTDSVHPDNRVLLEKVAQVVDDPLIGVDFIMDDISRSWKEQPRSGVIECNGCPFIDLHHYPLVGQPRNVAGALWELIYPSSAHHRS